MKLVFIYGPPSSGKLTIAQQLAKLTGFKLFHNHVSIQFVKSLFDFGTKPFWRLTGKYRLEMLEAAAKERVDTIFTFVYDRKSDDRFVRQIVRRVSKHHGQTIFVRLVCDPSELSRRVKNASRKSIGKISTKKLLSSVIERYDLFSEIPQYQSLTIDTTTQSPKSAARKIVQYYHLPVLSKKKKVFGSKASSQSPNC